MGVVNNRVGCKPHSFDELVRVDGDWYDGYRHFYRCSKCKIIVVKQL